MWRSMRMAVATEPLPTAPGVLQDPMHPLNVAHFTWAVIYRALCTFSPDTLVLRRRRHHSQHTQQVKQQEEEEEAAIVQHSLLTPPRSETHSRHHHHTHHRRRSSSRASSVQSYSRDVSRVGNEQEEESERNRSRASSEGSQTHHRHTHHSRSKTHSQETKKEEEERGHHRHTTTTTTTTKKEENSTGSSIARRAHSADDAQRRHRSRPRRSTSPPKDTHNNNGDNSKKIEESEIGSEASHSQTSEQHAGERHSRRHHHRRTTSSSSHHHRSRSADQANTTRSSSSAQVLPQTGNKEEGSERVRSRTTSSSRGLTHSRRGRNGSESELNSSRASSHGEASLVEQEPLTTVNKIDSKVEVKAGEEVIIKESVQYEDVLHRLRPGEVNLPNPIVTGSVAVLGKPPLSGRHTPRHRTPSATRKTNKTTTTTTTTSNSKSSGEEEGGDKGELNVNNGEQNEGADKENEQLNTSTSRSAHKGRHHHRHHSRTASTASSSSHVRRSSLDSTHSKGKEDIEEEEEKNSEHGSKASRHRSHRTTKVSNTSLTSHTRTTRSGRVVSSSVSKSHHGHKSTSFYSSISTALYNLLGRRDVTRQVYLFSHVLRALPVLGLHWGCHLERQNATLPLLLTMNNSNSNKSGACAILAAMVPKAVTSLHTVQSTSSTAYNTTNSYPSQQYNALYEDDRSYIYSSPAIALTTLMTRTTLQLLCHSARQVFFFDDTIAAVHLRSRRFGKRLTGWLLRLGAHTLLDMVFLSVMTPLLCVAADTNIDSGSVLLSENVFVQKMCITVPGILNACLNSCAAATLECLIVPWLSQLVNRALVTVCETTEYFILRRYAAYNNTSSSSDDDEEEGEDSVERDKEKAQRRAAREAAAHNAIVRAILYRVAAGVGCACVVEHPLRVLVELLRGRATLHLTGLLAEHDAVPKEQCGLSWHSFRSYIHDLRNTSNINVNMNSNTIRDVKSDTVNISTAGSSEVPWWVALLRRMGANVGHEVTTIAQSIRHASQQADSLVALEARANAALALGARPSMSESVEYLLRSIASYSPLYGGVQFSVLDKLLSFYMAVWVRLRRQS